MKLPKIKLISSFSGFVLRIVLRFHEFWAAKKNQIKFEWSTARLYGLKLLLLIRKYTYGKHVLTGLNF